VQHRLGGIGRQTERTRAISGGRVTNDSITMSPSNPVSARAAKLASQSTVPVPGTPRSLFERSM
jgi:hypothetical protein